MFNPIGRVAGITTSNPIIHKTQEFIRAIYGNKSFKTYCHAMAIFGGGAGGYFGTITASEQWENASNEEKVILITRIPTCTSVGLVLGYFTGYVSPFTLPLSLGSTAYAQFKKWGTDQN